jgi:peptidyl-prolyl cis-trans isomerase C
MAPVQNNVSKGNNREVKRRLMKVLRHCIALIIAVVAFGITFAYSSELARVDGTVIKDSDLLNRMNLLPRWERAKFDKEKFLNKMIDEELILREAQKMNMYDREDYKLRVENFKRELLVNLYLQQYLGEKITEENQLKYYEQHKDKYTSMEMVKIAVIKLKTEEEANEISKRATAGEDFAELAKKYSKGPAADHGGEFGWRAKKALRKEFADAAFSMKKGEIKGPLKLEDGYYIIKLIDHKEEGIAKYEDVKSKVANEYAKKLMDEKIAELRKAAQIQINAAELKELKIQ